MPRLSLIGLSLLLSLLLSSCASNPTQNGQLPTAQGSVTAAQAAEAEGGWQQAASEWLALAGVSVDTSAQQYRSRALSALLLSNDALRARAVFDSIDAQLLGENSQDYLAVLQAELLLLEGRPNEALVVLPLALGSEAELSLRMRFLAARATAFAEQGALVPAIEDFSVRNRMMTPGAVDQQAWQFRLWPLLVSADEALLREGLRRNANAEVAGWLNLGLIGQGEWLDSVGFENKLNAWALRNRLHVANSALLPALREAHVRRQTYPQNITILLPLSGRYATVGIAVRDGLLAAWYDLAARKASGLPVLSFIDTEVVPATQWLADSAASADVETAGLAVIGPLRKEKLEALASLDRPENMLWLPLNYSELLAEKASAVSRPLALALSPEQEARMTAQRMGRDGHRSALVIAAEGGWGQRVIDAFSQEFIATGGAVVGVERYDTGQSDYGDTIQRALLLDQSERRHARMTRILGRNINFEARRRADVDAVFAPGLPRALRALRPQLKYYRASALPVYATSHVWAGEVNPASDLDLNGVKFAGMPWNLQPSARDKALKTHLAKAGRNVKRGRFYALGADALRVLPILADQDGTFPWVFPGGSGLLAVGDEGLLKRKLVWAEFRKGKPALLPAAKLRGRDS